MTALDTLETWAPHVGSTFAIGDEGEKTLELVEAKPGKPNGSPGRAPFALVFEGARDSGILPQRMYELTHRALGRRSIFLVPIGANATRVRYEAIFN